MTLPVIGLYIHGQVRDINRLRPEEVDLVDVATTLAKINRFIGRTDRPYSVAQHAVITSLICLPGQEFECLHHDDTEAYVGDIPSPIKRFLGKKIQGLEARIRRRAIAPALGLDPKVPDYVHVWDKAALTMEQYHRQGRREIVPHCRGLSPHLMEACDLVQDSLTWDEARDLYLARHKALIGG